jgi:ABC-type multidrug transport system fused ATPase/permease subunit
LASVQQTLNTIIGERGCTLSGGQKQRLELARVLLKKPQIVIPDELTSALDVETEALIKTALQEFFCDKTVVIISHKLTLLDLVDEIIVLKDGHAVERGSHNELLIQKGEYYKIYNCYCESLVS